MARIQNGYTLLAKSEMEELNKRMNVYVVRCSKQFRCRTEQDLLDAIRTRKIEYLSNYLGKAVVNPIVILPDEDIDCYSKNDLDKVYAQNPNIIVNWVNMLPSGFITDNGLEKALHA